MNLSILSFLTGKKNDKIKFTVLAGFFLATPLLAQHPDKVYLKRSLDSISVAEMEISTETAHYSPMFGAGDKDSGMIEGVNRYGHLRVEPDGSSNTVNYGREELVYYVLEGTGMLKYRDREVPISKDDFFYVPIDTNHSFYNPREDTLDIMVMGFGIPAGTEVEPTPGLQLASARDVSFQVLGQLGHGPTSRFRLLLGPTYSRRDRIAAAFQVNSMYVIDFDHGGTNNPHRHPDAEEIYFLLEGSGEMVAGETPDGEPRRHQAEAGDTFFFSRNSLVGFYSGTTEEEPHTRILAVRSKVPDQK